MGLTSSTNTLSTARDATPPTERERDDETIAEALDARLATTPGGFRDIFLHPFIAAGITIGLIALCTWWISWLRVFSGDKHPYTILYLIPVAVAAAFLGVRGGISATIVVLVVARTCLLNGHKGPFVALTSWPDLSEGLEVMTLTMGTLAIAAVTGRLRSTLVELRSSNERLETANYSLAAANQQLIESERLRRDFNRDVLLAVTAGKLVLVDHGELPGMPLADAEPSLVRNLREPVDATALRQELQRLVAHWHMDVERASDLLMSVTEGATNAIKHGKGGEARIWISKETVSVLIADRGDGIAPSHLARATLEKGYSTRISLGMGFHLMLETCDEMSLSTGENGTTILLHVSNCPRGSESDRILARYLKE